MINSGTMQRVIMQCSQCYDERDVVFRLSLPVTGRQPRPVPEQRPTRVYRPGCVKRSWPCRPLSDRGGNPIEECRRAAHPAWSLRPTHCSGRRCSERWATRRCHSHAVSNDAGPTRSTRVVKRTRDSVRVYINCHFDRLVRPSQFCNSAGTCVHSKPVFALPTIHEY